MARYEVRKTPLIRTYKHDHFVKTGSGQSQVKETQNRDAFVAGLQTFSQLVKFNVSSATYTVFGTHVDDAPRFEFRGVMADTSRNFVSLGELRLLCDTMEASKLNALHLHLTDTQSWPIEIEGFPLLTQWLAYGNKKFDTAANGTTSHIYTMKEMGALVDYCLDRAVRVIPEVDMPGHLVAQHAYPSYFAPQDNPHGCGTNANMTCERGLIDVTTSHGFEFIEGIWKSLIATFPGGEYHLGGDEVWSVP
jgi:hexosaminidase